MSMRDTLDISAYLVIGPENTLGRPVGDVVSQALDAGFTIIQVRSKVLDARDLMSCAAEAAHAIAEAGLSDKVPLLIDDRLDVALACRERGIKVDGVHVGQSDIPADICRKYLGPDAIVGLSASQQEVRNSIIHTDLSDVDYLGVGPLHETATKPESGRMADGSMVTRTLDELTELVQVSPKPIVVGGGVKAVDIPDLAKTGVAGFFVVSAVAGAQDPYVAAHDLVSLWRANSPC